jgi:hypothetical protein
VQRLQRDSPAILEVLSILQPYVLVQDACQGPEAIVKQVLTSWKP